MDKTLSVENQILLLSARRDVDPAAIEALVDDGALVHHGVNWDTLQAAARRHHLLPLLYERLAQIGGDRIPADVIAHLRGAYYTNLLRNQRLGAELAEVVAALAGAGVQVIVLKGGALAWTVYANPAQRPMVDLDLLLRPGDMDAADAVLESLGFHLPASLPARMVPYQKRFGTGLEWRRSRGGRTTYLDVQQYLVGVDWCRDSFPVEAGALWAAVRPLVLDGTPAWQLSAEDTLINLCLHPPLHHGYSCPLIGYVDMDRVITAPNGALSWPRLIERAGHFGVRTVVYYGLRCARDLLGTPLPPEVLDALQPGSLQLRILGGLAPLGREAVLQGADRQLRGARRILLHAALVDHFTAVGGVVRGLLFPGEEWLAARYSLETQGRARLYCLIHPLHVARAFVRGLQRPTIVSSFD